MFICGTHECFAFLGEDCGGTFDGGVDERDDLETRAELMLDAEGVIPRTFFRAYGMSKIRR